MQQKPINKTKLIRMIPFGNGIRFKILSEEEAKINKIYGRRCRRCDNIFKTNAPYSQICDDCMKGRWKNWK